MATKGRTKFKFNTHDLAKEVKSRFGDKGITIQGVKNYLPCICETILALIEQGEVVSIYGFGRFETVIKKGRTYNLKGREIVKEDSKGMKFTPAKNVRAKLKEDDDDEY